MAGPVRGYAAVSPELPPPPRGCRMKNAAHSPASRTRTADRYSADRSPSWNAEYAAPITSLTSPPCPAASAPPAPAEFGLDGTPPVSTAWITMDWKFAGMPRCLSWAIRLELSRELTSAPSTATPVTAPISRLVLVAEAAIPDRSGGTADSADDVIGTTVAPMPIPVSPSAEASVQ